MQGQLKQRTHPREPMRNGVLKSMSETVTLERRGRVLQAPSNVTYVVMNSFFVGGLESEIKTNADRVPIVEALNEPHFSNPHGYHLNTIKNTNERTR